MAAWGEAAAAAVRPKIPAKQDSKIQQQQQQQQQEGEGLQLMLRVLGRWGRGGCRVCWCHCAGAWGQH